MGFLRKKNTSVIDQRLRDLEKEIARLENEAQAATLGKSPAGSLPAPAAPRPLAPAPGPARRTDDLFAHAEGAGPDRAGGLPSDGRARRMFSEGSSLAPGGREKFGRLFTTRGDFQSLHPSRQDGRLMRNRAIVMAVVAALALIWLVYYVSR